MKHDANRQIEYIQQAFSQNSKSIGVFVGAGCPLGVPIEFPFSNLKTRKEYKSPLIQDVAGLTKVIIEKLKNENGTPSACDKLVKQLKEDGISNPNIEDILSHLRSLRQVAGTGTVREFDATDLDRLDIEICRIVTDEVDRELPFKDTAYHNLAAWVRDIPRLKPVHVFTTNYDLLFEQALEELACPYFDGFIGSRNAFFDLGAVEDETLLPARWCRLWKIHGSINWKINQDQKVVRSDKIEKDEKYLIYPSHLKYDQSRKMPYLAMLDRLKHFILTPSSILFLSGYSFSDDHINDIIVQSLKSNPTAMCFAFLYGQLDEYKYKKARDCAYQVSNLSLLAFDQGIIGRTAGDWHMKDDDKIGEIPAEVIKRVVGNSEPTGNDSEKIRYEIRLGDFEIFGQFLKEMSFYEADQQ